MPKLATDMQTGAIGNSNFTYHAARIGSLGATEYTLVTIAVDETGSTAPFADELRRMLVTAVEACAKSPRSDNLLVRVVTFTTSVAGGVEEVHGFMPLADIDTSTYRQFRPRGGTPLADAAYSAIGAMTDYGAELMRNDFLTNAIAFIITDGDENSSTATPRMVKAALDKARQAETLESIVSVLVGVNAAQYLPMLQQFQADAGLDFFKDAKDATPGNLAKLAAFVSQSVSSQSQALGTGGPSQQISATI